MYRYFKVSKFSVKVDTKTLSQLYLGIDFLKNDSIKTHILIYLKSLPICVKMKLLLKI